MTQPPPRSVLLGYRLLGLRLPDAYRPWVAEDVKSRSFLRWRVLRTFLWSSLLLTLYAVGQRIGLGDWPAKRTIIRVGAVLLAYALFASRDVLVRRQLRWQRIDANGDPVEPRRLGKLSPLEAALLAVVVLVAWTGAATAFGYGLRPTGPAAVKCMTPDADLSARLTKGLKGKNPRLRTAQAVTYNGATVVVALVEVDAAEEKDKFTVGAWIVQPDGIYRLGTDNPNSTFPEVPQAAVDRVTPQALTRAGECLRKAASR